MPSNPRKKIRGWDQLWSGFDQVFQDLGSQEFKVGDEVDVDGKVFTVTKAKTSSYVFVKGFNPWINLLTSLKKLWHSMRAP